MLNILYLRMLCECLFEWVESHTHTHTHISHPKFQIAFVGELWNIYHITILIYDSCCCSVAKSCPALWDPLNYSTPGFPVLHYLLEFVQSHVHWVSDAIQPSHSLLPPSPPALSLSQHQSFPRGGSLHQVAEVLELQLQHQSFQWKFRVDFL